MGYYCNECKQPISPGEFEYSTRHFKRPLCMSCQKRTDFSQNPITEHAVSPKLKQDEDDFEIDVISNAQKVWKGVSKVVKERSIIGERDLNKWIADWRHARKGLDFSMESKHFFLGGADLDDFTKNIINMAEKNILVANPFVEACYLTDYLMDSARKGAEIKIVTRSPEMKEIKKAECHSRMRERDIALNYDNRIHSKIIVVDGKVAVVSSMNLYSGSSGGASSEAGIVSIDEKVVDSAASYIRKFF